MQERCLEWAVEEARLSGVVSWVWARECELVSIYYLGVFWFCAVVLFFETGSHVVQAESDLELMILPDPVPKY